MEMEEKQIIEKAAAEYCKDTNFYDIVEELLVSAKRLFALRQAYRILCIAQHKCEIERTPLEGLDKDTVDEILRLINESCSILSAIAYE